MALTAALTVAIAGAAPFAGAAEPSTPGAATAPARANAAALYARAADRLLADLPPTEAQLLDRYDDAPLNASVEALLARSAPVIQLMHEATAEPRADWGGELAPRDIAHHLGRLGRLRRLGALGVLQARFDLDRGRPVHAVDSLMGVAALGRHVGSQPLMVTHLVAVALEEQAIVALAEMLPRLPAEIVAGLPARLAALPDSAAGAEVVRGEYAFALRYAKEPPAGQPAGIGPAQVEASKPFYDRLAEAMTLQPGEFAAKVTEAVAALPETDRAVAAVIAPSMEAFREVTARAEARRAMLLAAADVVRRGPAALADHKDPFGDGPFQHAPRDAGFELRSALVVRGEPAKLIVGSADEPR